MGGGCCVKGGLAKLAGCGVSTFVPILIDLGIKKVKSWAGPLGNRSDLKD
jgi:hypothetical protein